MVDINETSCAYKNPDAPVEARVKDLLSRMTLPEKIGQMTQIERRVASPAVITDSFIGIHNKPQSFFPSFVLVNDQTFYFLSLLEIEHFVRFFSLLCLVFMDLWLQVVY